jgi:hypothetical protein
VLWFTYSFAIDELLAHIDEEHRGVRPHA